MLLIVITVATLAAKPDDALRTPQPATRALPLITADAEPQTNATTNVNAWGQVAEPAPRNHPMPEVALQGVTIAPQTARSSAIMTVDDGTTGLYQVGDMLSEQMRLTEVHPDHVVIEHAGRHHIVRFSPNQDVVDSAPDRTLLAALQRSDDAESMQPAVPDSEAGLAEFEEHYGDEFTDEDEARLQAELARIYAGDP